MSLKFFLLLFISMGIFIACKKNTSISNDPFNVTLHNCNGDKNNSPYICFDSLINESRCPANAICIWSGFALIKVSFHENGNTHVFKMIIPAVNPMLGGVNDTTINGYHLTLSSLNPYPGTGSNDVPSATIKITQ
jgi:hypothetical protein